MCTWLENMDVCVFYGCVGKKKSPHSQHLKITIIYHPIASMDQKSGLNLAGSPLSISQAEIKVFLWGAPLPCSCGCWQSSAPCCCVSEFLYFSSFLLGKDPSQLLETTLRSFPRGRLHRPSQQQLSSSRPAKFFCLPEGSVLLFKDTPNQVMPTQHRASLCGREAQGFPSVVKNPPADTGDWGSIPGSGRSPGEGNGTPLQYSCLENPMDRGAWQASPWGRKESYMTQPRSMAPYHLG